MIKLAICDDESITLQLLNLYLQKIFDTFSIEACFSLFQDGNELLIEHDKENFDVIFLDIDMPLISGFDAAKKIREKMPKTHIVFVTSKRELVYDSLDYMPFHFVCKSTDDRLQQDLKHVVEKLLVYIKQNTFLTLYDSSIGNTSVNISNIVYVQSEKHYLLYYLTDNDIALKVRDVMSSAEKTLLEYDFIKPHQRFLVNMSHINVCDVYSNKIIMDNGAEIPISKSLKVIAAEKFMVYKRR